MNPDNAITRADLKDLVLTLTGATATGVARVDYVPAEQQAVFRQWVSEGCHADMSYLERYDDVRSNPALLLEGDRTVVMAAFSYANSDAVREMKAHDRPLIAEYALGTDYHKELRRRMKAAGRALTERCGGTFRVCIDTAPLRERFWARQAGLGFIGKNNYLIIPGLGMHFYLAALLWTGTPSDGFDSPCGERCDQCGACSAACPTGALRSDGRLDARRCLSYLTIESREPLPADINPGKRLFGCDTCRRVCPHEPKNASATPIEAFRARKEVVSLTRRDWLEMDENRFKTLFGDSAVSRTTLSHLRDVLSAGTKNQL